MSEVDAVAVEQSGPNIDSITVAEFTSNDDLNTWINANSDAFAK
jgi:hypothetical protein